MPSYKYTQPPGPFRPSNGIAPDFRFDEDARKDLLHLLPSRSCEIRASDGRSDLGQPNVNESPKMSADDVIAWIEEWLSGYRAGEQAIQGARRQLTPARERAAIRDLLGALEPFRKGWLSEQTVDLIPTSLWEELERRATELEHQQFYSVEREQLKPLCEGLGVILGHYVRSNEIAPQGSWMLDFVDRVLTLADIKHPDRIVHPERLEALIFPSRSASSPK
jgi:hypothetical protein